MAKPRDEWIEIGVIARAHGVRGHVRVRLADPDSEALSEVEEVALGSPARRVRIAEADGDAAGYRVRFEGIEDRDAADALRGLKILVERKLLPEAEDDEVYLADLVGCEVVDEGGRVLGEVRAVRDLGEQALLVLDGDIEIPFVDGIVTNVDIEGRRISCELPEGLLEINAPGSNKGLVQEPRARDDEREPKA